MGVWPDRRLAAGRRRKQGGEVGVEMVEEAQLIGRAKAGDREAVNALVREHWQGLYRFVVYKVGHPEDAQELVQETWLRLVRSLPQYQPTGAPFKSYLYRIALNLITDFWRKQGRRPSAVELLDCQQAVPQREQPEMQVLSQEMRSAILGVLQELPAEQRRAVELRLLGGLSVKETALLMERSEGAVKMLQQRALKQLRLLLATRGILAAPGGR